MHDKSYDRFIVYGQSKMANILFTAELQKRLDAQKPELDIMAFSLHPGIGMVP